MRSVLASLLLLLPACEPCAPWGDNPACENYVPDDEAGDSEGETVIEHPCVAAAHLAGPYYSVYEATASVSSPIWQGAPDPSIMYWDLNEWLWQGGVGPVGSPAVLQMEVPEGEQFSDLQMDHKVSSTVPDDVTLVHWVHIDAVGDFPTVDLQDQDLKNLADIASEKFTLPDGSAIYAATASSGSLHNWHIYGGAFTVRGAVAHDYAWTTVYDPDPEDAPTGGFDIWGMYPTMGTCVFTPIPEGVDETG